MKFVKYFSVMGATLFLSASLLAGVPQSGQQPAPDNTKNNQGDASQGAMTSDQQKMNPADRNTTRQIRKSIMADQSLSSYAHNIKIITRDGKVTLKGPVRTEEDKASIEAKAVAIAVFNPKHRRKPRATLYSPPPSHTLNRRVVRIRPSPGSSRSMTSPRDSKSN